MSWLLMERMPRRLPFLPFHFVLGIAILYRTWTSIYHGRSLSCGQLFAPWLVLRVSTLWTALLKQQTSRLLNRDRVAARSLDDRNLRRLTSTAIVFIARTVGHWATFSFFVMILGQITYIDCIVFVLFLIPQLLIRVNLYELIVTIVKALPYLGIIIPFQFIHERFIVSKHNRSPFVQRATPFEDFVIRYVRYAFAYMSARIGRVFFGKAVALPFTQFRMLRHGVLKSDIPWREVGPEETGGVRGLLFTADPTVSPDIVIYYCHGGGFSMGSPYFYLEPCLTIVHLLKAHYKNPALFSLDYDLVPDKQWPNQAREVSVGYDYTLSLVHGQADRICCGGDSAGGTLILSLLLELANQKVDRDLRPGYATLLSPWVTLVSEKNQDNNSDFLCARSLHEYALEYAGAKLNLDDPVISPGRCRDIDLWTRASPKNGFYFVYGSEEVLAPEIRSLIKLLRNTDVHVSVREENGCVHAWVIANLFLANSHDERIFGMKEVVKAIAANIPPLEKGMIME